MLDLYYYGKVAKSLTTKCYDDCKLNYVRNPREDKHFVIGLDNLTPELNLVDILYCPLSDKKDHNIGVLQFVNFTRGSITEKDMETIQKYANIIGTFICLCSKMICCAHKLDDLVNMVNCLQSSITSEID